MWSYIVAVSNGNTRKMCYFVMVSEKTNNHLQSLIAWWVSDDYFPLLLQAVTNVTALAQVDREKIYQWINELSSPETRENALLELSKKRESVPDLAPMLWHSCGTIAALLQVCICSFYLLLCGLYVGRNCFPTYVFFLFLGNSEHLSVYKPTYAYSSPVQQSV